MLPLADLFMPDEEVLARNIKDALATRHMSLTADESLPAIGIGAISGSLARHVRALFPNDVGQLFLSAWNNSMTLRQYLEKTAHSPGKEIFLQLSEHKIKTTHQPHVALMKDGLEIARVQFEASIELTVQAAVLRLRDGAVQDIQTGRVKGKVTLKCVGAIVFQKEIEPTAIPGTIKIEGTRAAGWLPTRPVRRAS